MVYVFVSASFLYTACSYLNVSVIRFRSEWLVMCERRRGEFRLFFWPIKVPFVAFFSLLSLLIYWYWLLSSLILVLSLPVFVLQSNRFHWFVFIFLILFFRDVSPEQIIAKKLSIYSSYSVNWYFSSATLVCACV